MANKEKSGWDKFKEATNFKAGFHVDTSGFEDLKKAGKAIGGFVKKIGKDDDDDDREKSPKSESVADKAKRKVAHTAQKIEGKDLDYNGDGIVTNAEKDAFKLAAGKDGKLGRFLSGEANTREAFDFDRDGKITSSEVEKARKMDTSRNGYVETDERKAFVKMDKDHDGTISPKERKAAAQAAQAEQKQPERRHERESEKPEQKHAKAKDDGDKKPGLLARIFGRDDDNAGRTAANSKKPYDAADLNEDGKVNRTERATYNNLKELVAEGKLSPKEFEKDIKTLHNQCRGEGGLHASAIRNTGGSPERT